MKKLIVGISWIILVISWAVLIALLFRIEPELSISSLLVSMWCNSTVIIATIYIKKHPQFVIASLAIFLFFTINFLTAKSQGSTGALIFVFLPIYSIGFGVIVQYLSSLADENHNQDDIN